MQITAVAEHMTRWPNGPHAAFTHALVRETLYIGQSQAKRRVAQKRVAAMFAAVLIRPRPMVPPRKTGVSMVPEHITHDIFVGATRETGLGIADRGRPDCQVVRLRWRGDRSTAGRCPDHDLERARRLHGNYRGRRAAAHVCVPLGAAASELPKSGNSTLVTFTIHPDGDVVRLVVTESGFRDLDLPEAEQANWAGDNQQGWQGGFATLLEVVATDAANPAHASPVVTKHAL